MKDEELTATLQAIVAKASRLGQPASSGGLKPDAEFDAKPRVDAPTRNGAALLRSVEAIVANATVRARDMLEQKDETDLKVAVRKPVAQAPEEQPSPSTISSTARASVPTRAPPTANVPQPKVPAAKSPVPSTTRPIARAPASPPVRSPLVERQRPEQHVPARQSFVEKVIATPTPGLIAPPSPSARAVTHRAEDPGSTAQIASPSTMSPRTFGWKALGAGLVLMGVLAVGSLLRRSGQEPSAAPASLPASALVLAASTPAHPSVPTIAAPARALPLPATSPAIDTRPSVGVVGESDEGATAALLRSWPTGASAQARIDPVTTAGWEDTVRALRTQPRVAVLRYDALQSALSAPTAAGLPPLEIVAPLSAEAICLVVRADSPLRFIHDIRGRSVDMGEPGSARALTTNLLYREMFRQSAPKSATRPTASAPAALDQLLAAAQSRAIVAVTASTLKDWLASHPLAARELKVLQIDPANVESQRAVGAFLVLPADVGLPSSDGATGKATTLGMLTFLVTARETGARAAPHEQDMTALARTLCRSLPGLRANGGAWRAVHPALELDVGIPYSESARSVLRTCDSVAVPIASPAAAKPSTAS